VSNYCRSTLLIFCFFSEKSTHFSFGHIRGLMRLEFQNQSSYKLIRIQIRGSNRKQLIPSESLRSNQAILCPSYCSSDQNHTKSMHNNTPSDLLTISTFYILVECKQFVFQNSTNVCWIVHISPKYLIWFGFGITYPNAVRKAS
jgi:hypothetical protein